MREHWMLATRKNSVCSVHNWILLLTTPENSMRWLHEDFSVLLSAAEIILHCHKIFFLCTRFMGKDITKVLAKADIELWHPLSPHIPLSPHPISPGVACGTSSSLHSCKTSTTLHDAPHNNGCRQCRVQQLGQTWPGIFFTVSVSLRFKTTWMISLWNLVSINKL